MWMWMPEEWEIIPALEDCDEISDFHASARIRGDLKETWAENASGHLVVRESELEAEVVSGINTLKDMMLDGRRCLLRSAEDENRLAFAFIVQVEESYGSESTVCLAPQDSMVPRRQTA